MPISRWSRRASIAYRPTMPASISALAIADADADILCLQETDNMPALQAFEYGYLFRMVGHGYMPEVPGRGQ
jgi:endonuclease/exonuclease/phosphatase family metal-dependent hydrolase